ncbi:MAG: MATE family efflux transporter [Anaerovoracaceae bacterium]|jgi:Na+-driven multidrug efflux pump
MVEERLDKNSSLLYRTLAKVAVPIALQSLIGSSLNLVDNLMVGSLGEEELAAVGVSVQIYFVFWMICYGFSSGCSTFMAQFWGAKDLPSIRKTVGFTLTACLCAGLVFFCGLGILPDSAAEDIHRYTISHRRRQELCDHRCRMLHLRGAHASI